MIDPYFICAWLFLLACLFGLSVQTNFATIIVVFVMSAITIALALALIPVHPIVMVDSPQLGKTFEEALARFKEMADHESSILRILPDCRSVLLQHGHATDRVAVLLHGMNHSPHQFAHLSQMIFATGANVLVPLAPFHGVKSNRNLNRVTAEQLQRWGDRAVQIANGLGRKIEVLGFSMGGTVALYLAGVYRHLNRVVAVAPGLLPKDLDNVSECGREMFVNFFSRVSYRSYSKDVPQKPNVIHGYSWTCVAQITRLGRFVQSSLPPLCPVVIVWNSLDDTVSNDVIMKYMRQNGLKDEYLFDETYQLPHDLIDWTRAPNIEHAVYPVLVAFLTRTLSSSSTQHT